MATPKKGTRKAARRKAPARKKAEATAVPVLASDGPAFGPEFFGAVLPRMIAACPCPEDHVPVCFVHLADGERLDVVEVLAVADRLVLLAVFEGDGPDGVPRTEDDIGVEAVPYELVLRVSVRRSTRRSRLGFHFNRDELVAATAEADGAARKNGRGGRRRPAADAAELEATASG